MHFRRLALHRFRNLADATLEFSPGLNLVSGRNGQGKTNLLEALHLLALAHSPRARTEKDCITWTQKSFVLRGEGLSLSGVEHAQSIEYGEDIRVKVNGEETRRLSALLGAFSLVSLSPEDLELVRGGPMARRRFLDVLLCQLEPGFIETLRLYQVAVKQRNAALRANADDAVLVAYETGIAQAGSRIIAKRQSLLDDLKPWAQKDYALLSRESEALGLRITRNPEQTSPESLLQELLRQRQRDREEGSTSVGPHRDDLMLFLAGKSAREFGSQGQKRSVALSLRMAAAQLLRLRMGIPPILLLDDVFAELDSHRQAALGELLRERGQAFIATPRQGEMPFAVDAAFQVEGGIISPA